jgi:eukaryotic-like serine/threonine-protein kinase
MRALSKNPADRYQTAEEFAAALRRARRPVRAPGDGVTAAGASAGVLAGAGTAVAAGAVGVGVLAASAGGSAAAAPGVPGLAAVTPAAPVARPAPPPAVPAPAAPAPATAVAAEAPTRYRAGGEPATSVRPRRRHRLRRVVLAFVLVALAAAGVWAAYVYLLAPGATVPAVVGQRRSDAAGALRDEGLKPVLHYVWADKHAKGEVARQAPRGGAKVEDGVKVDLWVSRGPLHIPSPDLTGLAASVARGRLEAESLNSRSRKAASETTPKGQIFRQQPAAGATVERGDTVTFWVSSGPPKVYVPDVVGLSQGDASATLEDAGFVVSTDYVAGWGEIPGTVVGQDPLADVMGRVGDEVVIQVAVF